jgi:hypothetical protein
MRGEPSPRTVPSIATRIASNRSVASRAIGGAAVSSCRHVIIKPSPLSTRTRRIPHQYGAGVIPEHWPRSRSTDYALGDRCLRAAITGSGASSALFGSNARRNDAATSGSTRPRTHSSGSHAGQGRGRRQHAQRRSATCPAADAALRVVRRARVKRNRRAPKPTT